MAHGIPHTGGCGLGQLRETLLVAYLGCIFKSKMGLHTLIGIATTCRIDWVGSKQFLCA